MTLCKTEIFLPPFISLVFVLRTASKDFSPRNCEVFKALYSTFLFAFSLQ